jgi:hypothetical protein
MAPSKSVAPVGLNIVKGYRVGKQLGEGAQASVHLLEPLARKDGASRPTFAIKLAPVAKTTKKGQTLGEINERSLRKEYLIYATQFPTLQQKGIVASLPRSMSVPHATNKELGT